jgi:mannose-6-phosphate isomerase-like protein (cupin superfamily)
MDSSRAHSRLDFAQLLAPITAEAFFGEYWERRPLRIARQASGYYTSLPSVDEVDRLISVQATDTIELINADNSVETKDFVRPDGSMDIVRSCQLFAAGATFLIRDAHKRAESLALLCREVERRTSAPCKANLYVTPPGGKGFDVHYDTHDVFVLQLEGSKEWTIYDAPFELPLTGQLFDPLLHPVGAATMSFVLDAGDLLYIPRGFLHEARSRGGVSLHATLGVLAYRWADVMLELMAKMCLSDPAFRRALPINLGRPEFDLEGALNTFAGLMQRVVENGPAESALEYIADELATGRRALVPGQLRQVAAAPGISADDYFGVRPTALYGLRVQGESLRVRAHGREIVVPAEAIPAVRFALASERFNIEELPGDLDEDTRLSLVRRLMEEGLIWKLDGP